MRFRKTLTLTENLKLPTQASAGTIVMRIIANIYIQQTRFLNAARKVLGFKSKLGLFWAYCTFGHRNNVYCNRVDR